VIAWVIGLSAGPAAELFVRRRRASAVEAWQRLRVGDRIRPVGFPPEWDQPGYHLPAETAELWRLLVTRRRSLRVYEVNAWGAPWVRCRIRAVDGGWEHHFLAVTHGGWERVKARRTGRCT
jgi:hypothetical protein